MSNRKGGELEDQGLECLTAKAENLKSIRARMSNRKGGELEEQGLECQTTKAENLKSIRA